MTEDEKKAADLKAAEKGTKAAEKGTKAAEKKSNPVADHFQEKGDQTKENLSKGGKPVVISLVNKTKVEFIKDHGAHIKKGHIQEVSETAFEIYNKAGVVKKL